MWRELDLIMFGEDFGVVCRIIWICGHVGNGYVFTL